MKLKSSMINDLCAHHCSRTQVSADKFPELEAANKMQHYILSSPLSRPGLLLIYLFRDRSLLCSPGWPQTHNPSASASQVLGGQGHHTKWELVSESSQQHQARVFVCLRACSHLR
jgi:hypothetical protein